MIKALGKKTKINVDDKLDAIINRVSSRIILISIFGGLGRANI